MSLFSRRPVFLFEIGATVAAAMAVALFSLFPGARLVGLILVVLAGLLFGLSPGRRGRWLPTPLDWPVLLLLVQAGLGFWASAQPDKSWVTACQLGAGLVAYYALVNWSRDRVRLGWALAALLVMGVGLALMAPFAVDWFRNRKTFLPAELYRAFPLLLPDSIHPNVMAGALVTLMPLPLALFLGTDISTPSCAREAVGQNFSPASRGRLRGGLFPERWRIVLRWALLAAALLQLAILILTKSRGGYLAAGVGLCLTLWLSRRRRWALALLLVGAVLAAVLLLQPAAGTVEGVDALDPLGATQEALDPSTWAFRQRVWGVALQLIADFPFTGVGLGTFNDVAALLYGFYAPQNPQAHNLFLQVGLDLGVLGLVGFLSIWSLALWAAFQAYRLLEREPALRAVAVGALSGLVATLAHGLIDVHTWGSKGAFIPWTLIGLAVALLSLALRDSYSHNGGPEGGQP